MVQRFCFAKLRDHEISARTALAEKLRAELVAAGADAIVGIPADDSAARWDLSVVITAASIEAWHAVSRLPAVATVLSELARRAEVLKAWTFEAVDGTTSA